MSELDFIDSRLYLPRREEAVLSSLSPEARTELSAITLTKSYARGAQPFVCEQAPVGIFIIDSGRVNLLICPVQGKPFRFATVRPGDLLGLIPTLAGLPHRTCAQTEETTEVRFIPRLQFLEFLAKHGEVLLYITEQICLGYNQALQKVRTAGSNRTAASRLARFLLEWPSLQGTEQNELRIEVPLTHGEIAQIIGLRRETLSRTFNEFRRTHLIRTHQQTIFIRSRAALEVMVNL